jgi:hypothetical protein
MEVFKRLVSTAVFGIQVLIAFILLFESQISVPLWLQAVGRLHLVLLHLPIGLFLLTALLVFTRKYFESESFDSLVSFLLHLTSLAASLSALMGLLLSFEGGYDNDALGLHKWLGLTMSFFSWILLMVSEDKFAFKPLIALGVILLVLTGHFGANLTHGEDFILAPLSVNNLKPRIITDSTTMFAATIEPIFERKCLGCHNEEKAKGKLVLTSLDKILKGGKNGVLWRARDADHSLLVKRIELPLTHKEHMPPKDKVQLTDDEINFINAWIAAGADVETPLKTFASTDSLRRLATQVMAAYISTPKKSQAYKFEFVSSEKLSELSTPNRSVFQLAVDEPALYAEFYLSGSFQKEYLEELKQVKDQLVEINLSKMPISDDDLQTIAQFPNVEKLILNNTNIDGSGFIHLKKSDHLQSISVSGTNVTAGMLKILGEIKSLREVHLWNTPVRESDLTSLQAEFKNIFWDIGYLPDTKELLQLSPPFVRNDGQVLTEGEDVMLKHNLPGAIIRYAFNNDVIDSTKSAVYSKPVEVQHYSLLKVKAFKDGWKSSDVGEFIFFEKGVKPTRGELKTKPNNRYTGDGIQTLIDNKKGMPDFYRDPAWMGFREEPLEAVFYFENTAPTIKNITLSFAKNIGAMCMPPSEMQVWGGRDEKSLKLLGRVTPIQPKDYTKTRIEGVSLDIPESNFACYKLIAKPLAKLPEFRKAPKEKGWLMIDEVFFN